MVCDEHSHLLLVISEVVIVKGLECLEVISGTLSFGMVTVHLPIRVSVLLDDVFKYPPHLLFIGRC